MSARASLRDQAAAAEIAVVDVTLALDPAGVLYWPDERALVVADLHLEKGSSFARRGTLLPPYDTTATLARLAELIARHDPRLVIALGDSFHDSRGADRIASGDRSALLTLQRGRDWLWVAGNHDSDPVPGIGGSFAAMLALGGLTFRHEPIPHRHESMPHRHESMPQQDGEIAGHLHPVARVHVRGQSICRRCFVGDGRRLVMPAFGAYAGGLNVRHRVFAGLFDGGFVAHLLGERRLYALDASRCVAD